MDTAALGMYNGFVYSSLRCTLVVVELEAHAIVNLVVFERDVVLVDRVPLLDPDFLRPGAYLGRNELLQISYRVVFVAFHADLLPQSIVTDNFDHLKMLRQPDTQNTSARKIRFLSPRALRQLQSRPPWSRWSLVARRRRRPQQQQEPAKGVSIFMTKQR
eukprot:gene21232-25560_t